MLSDSKTKLDHGRTPLIHGKTKLTRGKTKFTHGEQLLFEFEMVRHVTVTHCSLGKPPVVCYCYMTYYFKCKYILYIHTYTLFILKFQSSLKERLLSSRTKTADQLVFSVLP